MTLQNLLKYFALSMCFAAILLFATGCATLQDFKGLLSSKQKVEEPELVIPDLNTPLEQYTYATRYESVVVGIINPDVSKRGPQMNKVVQVHSRVVRNFPNDHEFTPLSKLTIADCSAKLGKYNEAIPSWQRVMSEYPDNSLVQARAKFAMARSYEQMGDFAKAKEIDREIVEQFASSTNARVRQYAAQSQQSYMRTRETRHTPKETPKAGFFSKFF